ncbi:hypothetical protein [Actinophytocola sp.]|uniref:hypothetical protein n=1 Tax=Actinophytocola sp. TaxID=1872138 RepID=UPI002D45A61B|nr:hypothetical protein [Actinophytocola sp.]HYQ68067.1 hypothetical protein [Actinophytocola sp.]
MARRVPGDGAPESRPPQPFGNGVIFAGLVWSLVAVAAASMYLLGGQGARLVGLAVLVLFASAAIGAIAGFLFGVPKSVPYVPREGVAPPPYIPNSNLEQVSDWLTKIIIGVGLVEIRQVAAILRKIATRLGDAFDNSSGTSDTTNTSAAFALTLILGGLLISFVLTYMWVRTRLFQVLAEFGRPPT